MWQDLGTVDVDFVFHFDVVTQDGNTFSSSPLSNSGVPTNNGRFDPGVVFDLGVGQQH